MLMAVTFLTALSRFPHISGTIHPCVPNSQFNFNGQLCHCDNTGRWSEANCQLDQRRHICQPGQLISQGCRQCICLENGLLSCSEGTCQIAVEDRSVVNSLSTLVPWCTPFRSYYMNCSICGCPASGRTSEAHCFLDPLCSKSPGLDMRKKNTCLPNTMYIFPCIHCLCSENGIFVLNRCINTCPSLDKKETPKKCISNKFYRKDCNVCLCPSNGVYDDRFCTRTICNVESNTKVLHSLNDIALKCIPHRFTKPICLYCECSLEGKVKENVCLELYCWKQTEEDREVDREKCIPEEMVPFCIECFCPRNGLTNDRYCTKGCSFKNKLHILNRIANDSSKNDRLINKDDIKKPTENELCIPNTVYVDQNIFCICPEDGKTNPNTCVTVERPEIIKSRSNNEIGIDFNVPCEPSTFIDFDCNTCFCSKQGTIDPKWCTYDDCESKRIIMQAHESQRIPEAEIGELCHPGSISKMECNFCICPDNAILDNSVCTKIDCSSFSQLPSYERFVCEPLAYYEVDCNTCFCPRDGLKNVGKCTKNRCDKSFLRSDACVPGQLFSDECNVCVCPPNGNKAEKACTNYTCADTAPWKKIFQLSESLVGSTLSEDMRSLELCFPGEEFVVGCKLCFCPDMGLKMYASCSYSMCDEELDRTAKSTLSLLSNASNMQQTHNDKNVGNLKTRRDEDCITFNFTNSVERQDCTPGSMYIIRCKQCICPYMGNINNFCRPLPKNFNCEQAYPYFNYKPMGRRRMTVNVTIPKKVVHSHTKYHCEKPGKLMDACFICECEEDTDILVEEHCFKSEEKNCVEATPTFLNDYDKIVLV